MKGDVLAQSVLELGRTPHGVRGLKCEWRGGDRLTNGVAPLTGCVD